MGTGILQWSKFPAEHHKRGAEIRHHAPPRSPKLYFIDTGQLRLEKKGWECYSRWDLCFSGLFFLLIVIFRPLNILQTHNNKEKYRHKQHKETVIINLERQKEIKCREWLFKPSIHPPLEIRPRCVFCASLKLLLYLHKEKEKKNNCFCPLIAFTFSPCHLYTHK